MINNTYVQNLFENIQNGDILGFWRSTPISKLIRSFQRKDNTSDLKLDDINHIGTVYNVSRSNAKGKSILTFNLSHQTASLGGSFDKWKIIYSPDLKSQYKINVKTKYVKLYWLSLTRPFTILQINNGLIDAKGEIGKRYGFVSFILSLPKVSLLLGKIFNYKLFVGSQRVCSKHVIINHLKAGRNVDELLILSPFPTPELVMTYQKGDLKGEIYDILDFKVSL